MGQTPSAYTWNWMQVPTLRYVICLAILQCIVICLSHAYMFMSFSELLWTSLPLQMFCLIVSKFQLGKLIWQWKTDVLLSASISFPDCWMMSAFVVFKKPHSHFNVVECKRILLSQIDHYLAELLYDSKRWRTQGVGLLLKHFEASWLLSVTFQHQAWIILWKDWLSNEMGRKLVLLIQLFLNVPCWPPNFLVSEDPMVMKHYINRCTGSGTIWLNLRILDQNPLATAEQWKMGLCTHQAWLWRNNKGSVVVSSKPQEDL